MRIRTRSSTPEIVQGTPRGRRAAMGAACSMVAVLVMASGCSESATSPASGEDSATSCPGETGENSAVADIAVGVVSASEQQTQKMSQLDTPQLRSNMQQGLQNFTTELSGLAGIDPTMSRDSVLKVVSDNLFADVPPGGDAAFVSAVCGLPTGYLGFDEKQTLYIGGIASDIDNIYRRTDNALRGTGRGICQRIKSNRDSEYKLPVSYDYMRYEMPVDDGGLYGDILKNPAEYVDGRIFIAEKLISDIDSGRMDFMFVDRAEAHAAIQKTLDYFTALSSDPGKIVDQVKAARTVELAAAEHICPDLE